MKAYLGTSCTKLKGLRPQGHDLDYSCIQLTGHSEHTAVLKVVQLL